MTTYQKSILEKLQELLTLIDYEETVRHYRENAVNGKLNTTKTVDIKIGEDTNYLTADLLIDYSTNEISLETTINEVTIEGAAYCLHEGSISEFTGDIDINTSNSIVEFN